MGRLLALALIFLACSSGFAVASDGTAVPDVPDNDDLKRTMECDWAITNTSEPTDPNDYENDQTDDLVKLAASLDNDPAKIYSWVYNNVYYPQYLYKIENQYRWPYYKYSRLGARGAYLNKLGNTWDQCSLLITLLRISGVPARYVRLNSSNLIFVEAYIEQDNYYGTGGGSQKTWVPMVPWLKEIELSEGLELFPTDSTAGNTVPSGLEYDFDNYLSSVKYTSPLEEYEEQLQEYLKNSTGYSNKSINEIPFKEKQINITESILPRSLPNQLKKYSSLSRTRFADIEEINPNDPDDLDNPHPNRASLRLYIKQGETTLLDYRIYAAAISGKRFALDWDYSGGSSFIPVLKIDGQEVKTGSGSINKEDSFNIEYKIYGKSELVTRPSRIAGTYIQMGIDPYSASVKTIEKAKQKLQTIDVSRVTTPSTQEEFLGLMGQVLVETFLNRLHENSKKSSRYFHGTTSWNLCPVFIYTKYHDADNHPIPTDTESKFYYHPQWNIDAQSCSNFYKWDHADGKSQILALDWNDHVFQTLRWLFGYAASYDEGRIFEDWMDTPGASTIKGLMVANEDYQDTGNRIVTLTQSDIATETTVRNSTFETVPVQNSDNGVDYYKAYDGFQFWSLKRTPDGWSFSYNGNTWPLNASSIDGSYGLRVWTNLNSETDFDEQPFIVRGTKFDLKSIKVSSIVDGVKYNFRGYRRSAKGQFVYVAGTSTNVTANKTPRTHTFNANWVNINQIKMVRVSSTNGPIVLDNMRYVRKEYLADLENETDLHLGYNTIIQITNELVLDNAKVTTPVQQVLYAGLEGNVRITHGDGSDTYSFGMDNGGAASQYVDYSLDNYIASTVTPSSYLSEFNYENFLDDYSIFTNSGDSTTAVAQFSSNQPTWAEKFKDAVSIAGDPVDMTTGEFYTEEEPDFLIKSRGFDLSVIRQYKSRQVYNGPFGYGWTWNHGERLLPLDDGGIKYYNNQGTLYEITYENGAYVYPAGTRFTLQTISGGYLITRNQSQVKSYFNADGYLVKREDRFGNTLEYEYTNTSFPSRITKIKDGLGQNLTLSYNTNGKAETVTDFTGRQCRYVYSGDDLIAFKGLDYDEAVDNCVKFEYLSSQENAFNDHNMTKYILPGGDYLEIGYFKNDQIAYHTNAKGETFNFHFSRLNRYSETWNEQGFYRKIFFNENGDVIRVSYEDEIIEEYAFDNHHNKISHTDGNGNITTFQYYPDGTTAADQDTIASKRRLYKKVDPLGNTWKYWYDDSNNAFSPVQS